MSRLLAAALVLAGGLCALPAQADSDMHPKQGAPFSELGDDLGWRKPERIVRYGGFLRVRADVFNNLDLDRGPTPSGQVLFPVPISDPSAQTLTQFDMRGRMDLGFYAPFGGVAFKLRLDVLENLALGSVPDGPPTAATGQSPPAVAFRVVRAWGEGMTPFGVLAAGRMGNHWGLGMLTNGGDCFDCDTGDAADRIVFGLPLLDHLWTVAFDFTSIGPTVARRRPGTIVDVEPHDNVYTFTFALLNVGTDRRRNRRRKAGKMTFEYGAVISHRWQDLDIPSSYVSGNDSATLTRSQVVPRGFTATAGDIWLKLTHPLFHIEAEAAVLAATYENASVLPGVIFNETVDALQWGFALESRFGEKDAVFSGGFNMGAASGDPAFGFGVNQTVGDAPGLRGDLDGPQANLATDRRYDNFRFHPDYQIDRILFREIIGTVTDAVYIRPHVRALLTDFLGGRFEAELAVVASWAMESSSTPGGASPLGVEIDPTISYTLDDGLRINLHYAVLFPLAGLDNPELGLSAKPAQLFAARIGYLF